MKLPIADDSRVMRQIVIPTLRQAGYDGHDVVEAENGRDALDKVASPDGRAFDLVLSDWNMPEMTGIECLRALRAQGSDVPFGFVISEGSDDMRSVAAAAGALFLMAKPFTRATFEAHLARVIG